MGKVARDKLKKTLIMLAVAFGLLILDNIFPVIKDYAQPYHPFRFMAMVTIFANLIGISIVLWEDNKKYKDVIQAIGFIKSKDGDDAFISANFDIDQDDIQRFYGLLKYMAVSKEKGDEVNVGILFFGYHLPDLDSEQITDIDLIARYFAKALSMKNEDKPEGILINLT